jgi:hypothetical protein
MSWPTRTPSSENKQLFLEGKKRCSICKEIKLLEHFGNRKLSPDGKQYVCGSCNNKASYNHLLNWKHGISREILDTKIKEQDNRCLICNSLFGFLKDDKPHVDHDHKNNKFRGIICGRCNKALGNIKDNAETAYQMAIYLGWTNESR